jgi:hypothetical protein
MSIPGRATTAPTSTSEPVAPERTAPERAVPEDIEPRAQEAAVGPDAIAPEAERVDQATDDSAAPLFSRETADELWRRWDAIQAGFVDEPRRAVQDADTLVDDIVKRLADSFANARTRLEGRWDRGDNVSTEDLRLALQQYRSFFKRLLAV